PPPPPSPPGTPVNIFPSITTSTDFATLGYELSVNPSQPIKDGFSVRYDAVSNSYIFDLPSHAPGEYRATSSDDKYWNGGLPAGTILWPPMAVLKPGASNPLIQLDHTSFAYYQQAGPMEDLPHGVVAFGTPTAAGAVPTTGSATTNAIVSGITSERLGTIGGTATFNFDFGAGTLTGQFNPVLGEYYATTTVPLGTYTFSNTVFGVGSPSFSGSLTHSDPRLGGAFEGVFTGPAAQELMARWTATFFVAGVTPAPEQMFGVMVGKKCC
ncbi:MAG: hypothetical protein V4696_14570, partial [Pseudomonadota bacterium]